jgi:hypothetical protein
MWRKVSVGFLLALIGRGALIAPMLATAAPSRVHAAVPVRFEVRFSKPLAVYRYVAQLSSRARSNNQKTQFMASRFAAAPYLQLLTAFDSIPTDYEYRFAQYPDLKIEGSTWYVLKRNLILAASFDDFRTRSLGLIPTADLNRLVDIFQAFTPVYDSLVYEPNRAVFERQLHDIERMLAERKVSALLAQIRAFYRASWDPSVPFI